MYLIKFKMIKNYYPMCNRVANSKHKCDFRGDNMMLKIYIILIIYVYMTCNANIYGFRLVFEHFCYNFAHLDVHLIIYLFV